MIRCAVFSDSHGMVTELERLLMAMWDRVGSMDYYLHLGDGVTNLVALDKKIWQHDPKSMRYGVRGNNDFDPVPDERVLRMKNANVLMTHGHRYGVKLSTDRLLYKAMEENCAAALYGHTHCPALEEKCGILLMNPGSVMNGRCGILTIHDDGKAEGELLRF